MTFLLARCSFSFLSGLALAAGVTAQTWTGRYPAAVPDTMFGHAMAYDAANGVIVMFGGLSRTRVNEPPLVGRLNLDETYEWNGTDWTMQHPVHRPAARNEHVMVYDAARNVVLMFGGRGSGENFVDHPLFDDTWEWDGIDWVQRQPLLSPPPRYAHAMSYDSRRNRTVLFGGAGAGLLGDTWEWNGSDWNQKFPATSPPARMSCEAAFHAVSRKTVLFGGLNTARLCDTWEWDGGNWRERVTSPRPQPRENHAMAYDPRRGRVVLFSGAGGVTNDTWEWNGSGWQLRSPATSPPQMYGHDMAYDDGRRRMVMFGGFLNAPTTTWEYQ